MDRMDEAIPLVRDKPMMQGPASKHLKIPKTTILTPRKVS
jgi:hypothetical protein